MKQLLLIIFMALTSLSNAQLPEFKFQDYYLSFTMNNTLSYTVDKNIICDSVFYYKVKAIIPPQGVSWMIDKSVCETLNVAAPLSLFCDILDAYQTTNVNEILGLYTPASNAIWSPRFAVDSTRQKFVNVVQNTSGFEILMALEMELGIYWIVNAHYADGSTIMMPFISQQIDQQWYFSAAFIESAMTSNIATYLKILEPYEMITDTDDQDGDGVPNLQDNCPCTANPGQQDSDGDGYGDECDNCTKIGNPDQNDSDMDGAGDACDNCKDLPNSSQLDMDGDGFGDACDNCPETHNILQTDLNLNGFGDACDPDIDGDGILNEEDPDIDADEVLNDDDNCPYTYNPFQMDADDDNLGASCDNCPLHYNPEQEDMDGDGIGDLCDEDRDGDGVLNDVDNCPDIPNPLQIDEDCDGVGDVCETPEEE